jgi:hypothetical protein
MSLILKEFSRRNLHGDALATALGEDFAAI